MINSVGCRIWSGLQDRFARKICCLSPLVSRIHHQHDPPSEPDLHGGFKPSCISPSYFALITSRRHLHADSSDVTRANTPDVIGLDQYQHLDDSDEEENSYEWEEEDEGEPEIGDGGRGGGVVLNNCRWGEKALSIAQEIIQELGEEFQLFAFKTTPKGYIYVRLENLSGEHGSPSLGEIESFSRQFMTKLEEEIPDNLALDVSSPGADRLLRVAPDDLLRFKDRMMVVNYLENSDGRSLEKQGVYLLDSIDTELKCCVWKLADVRENRDPAVKGKPLNRKQRESKLKLPYDMIKRVQLYHSLQRHRF